MNGPLIAGFNGDINIENNTSLISFREIFLEDQINERFKRSREQILRLLYKGFGCECMAGFKPTHIFLATWRNVRGVNTDIKVSYLDTNYV